MTRVYVSWIIVGQQVLPNSNKLALLPRISREAERWSSQLFDLRLVDHLFKHKEAGYSMSPNAAFGHAKPDTGSGLQITRGFGANTKPLENLCRQMLRVTLVTSKSDWKSFTVCKWKISLLLTIVEADSLIVEVCPRGRQLFWRLLYP